MSIVPRPLPKLPTSADGEVLLRPGDRMSQKEFHARYVQYHEGVRFELVGGVVYMAPMGRPHSRHQKLLALVMELYEDETQGVESLHGATVLLGEEGEPEPDSHLRILEEYGGQSRVSEDNYIEGAPELVAETAYSTRTFDLKTKRKDYEQAGVVEYIVLSANEPLAVVWHHFPTGQMIVPNRLGVAKSITFPGLWLHIPGLLALDRRKVRQVAEQGFASHKHAAFVRRLQANRREG